MRFERMCAFLQPESQSGGIGHYPTDTMLNYIRFGYNLDFITYQLYSIKFYFSSVLESKPYMPEHWKCPVRLQLH